MKVGMKVGISNTDDPEMLGRKGIVTHVLQQNSKNDPWDQDIEVDFGHPIDKKIINRQNLNPVEKVTTRDPNIGDDD